MAVPVREKAWFKLTGTGFGVIPFKEEDRTTDAQRNAKGR